MKNYLKKIGHDKFSMTYYSEQLKLFFDFHYCGGAYLGHIQQINFYNFKDLNIFINILKEFKKKWITEFNKMDKTIILLQRKGKNICKRKGKVITHNDI